MLSGAAPRPGRNEAACSYRRPDHQRKERFGIRPPVLHLEAGRSEELAHTSAIVLAADLGPDGFTSPETHHAHAGDPDLVVQRGDKMHFDPVGNSIVERAMLERLGVEICAKLMIQHQQHVAIESRRYTGPIVIRCFDARYVLPEVYPHEETISPVH